MSEAGARKQEAWLAASVKAMETGFDYARLDPETQLSWDLWKRQYENARDGLAFLDNGYTFDQMNGAQSFLPTFMIRSEERRVGKECVRSVDLGGRSSIQKNKTTKTPK